MEKNKKIVNLIGLVACVCVMLYMVFIFLLGAKREWIPEMMQESTTRLMIIYGLHGISSVCLVLYYVFFCNFKKYKGRIVAFPIINIIICLMGLFYIYKIGLEALILSMTMNGVLMGIFLWLRTYVLSSASHSDGNNMPLILKFVRIISIVSILFYIFSIGIYYRYFTWFLNGYMSSYQMDAMSIFFYIVSAFSQVIAFIMMYFVDTRKIQ